MQVVIFKNNEGVICVLYPTPEVLNFMTLKQVAIKDVPFGIPFKIINVKEVPTNNNDRLNWAIDDTEFNDGIGGINV